jgi:predicted nucleic acid-binding protein
VLNELTHKLILGKVAQKQGLKPSQVVKYLKEHREILAALETYEIISEIVPSYGLAFLDVSKQTMKLARHLMQTFQLLSNDALHLAAMQEANIRDMATNDFDFEAAQRVITIWKPRDSSR